jgi:transcriptional regulator with XRE-family HTH domain
MPRRIRGQLQRRRTFLRQWRESKNLTLEAAASQFQMSAAQLSRIETGKAPYTQDFLELAAEAYGTEPASLLIRDPGRKDALWSIWDQAKPAERERIAEIFEIIKKTGS